MTREIKFRAWDKKTKTMSIGFTLREIESDFGHQITTPDFFVVDECEIQQFTGLQDKNGKDIYEGDICRNHIYNTLDKLHVVEWRDGVFRKSLDQQGPEWLAEKPMFVFKPLYNSNLIFSNDQIEVIGNIYENPELLSHD